MLKKSEVIEVPIEKNYQFNFDIEGVEYVITSRGTSEVNALLSLRGDIHSIELDINNELRDIDVTSTPKERAIAPRKKITTPLKEKVVVEEAPMIQSGIKFNTPKVVNNPGFQPKFIEKVD